MSIINAAFKRDANYVPIQGEGLVTTKTITYAAASTGATGATTLFNVTGTVAVSVFGVCSVDLTGLGTIEVGVSGNTAALIAQTTGSNIDAGEIWVDTGPATVEALPAKRIVINDVIQTIATDTLTAGTLTYYCVWVPLSEDGNVTAA